MLIVYAKTRPEAGSRGITAFIFETKTPGYHVARKLEKVGMHGSPTGELVFEDAFVPEENVLGKVNEGFKVVMSGLDIERAFFAVSAIGGLEAALEMSIKYAKEREQFGQPIANFQLIQAKIADMYTDLEAARHMAHRGIWLAQQGKRVSKEAAAALLFTARAAMRAANEALQIHGGWGYLTDFEVERMWRNAKPGRDWRGHQRNSPVAHCPRIAGNEVGNAMKSVRIAGGLGFYGDSWRPIRASIERGNVQYVASDHLAELTLAILQKDRQRDPNLGYTRDFVPMLLDLLPIAMPRGVKFILNAGGLNPLAAREVLLGALQKFGMKLKVGVVLGDSVLERLDELQEAGVSLAHMDTGEDIATVRERLLFASAYLGARPLVEALDAGADIVLTGRVADAALFLAPMVHELGWRWDEWDKLAQGMVVGHLLECSGQATGGNFGGDWRSIPDLAHIGYPIAEVWENGDAVISKAPGNGWARQF